MEDRRTILALEPAWTIGIPAMSRLPHASASPFLHVHAFRTAQRHVHAARALPAPSRHSSHTSPHCLEWTSAFAVVIHRIFAAGDSCTFCPSVHVSPAYIVPSFAPNNTLARGQHYHLFALCKQHCSHLCNYRNNIMAIATDKLY